jgi:hypothetical protein
MATSPRTYQFNQVGFDSLGNPLPAGFDNYAQAITPGTYGPTAITATGPGGSYIQSFTYDGSGNLTASSAWVKQ